MKKRFLVIILCLFVDNFQASLGNNISQKLGRLFLNVKQPVLEHKYKIGLGIGVLAIAGAVWWYKGPPKGPFFNPLSRLRDTMMRREIVNTQELIDQSQIESQKREKEVEKARKNIQNILDQIDLNKAQELTVSGATGVSQLPGEQITSSPSQLSNQKEQSEQPITYDPLPEQTEEQVVQTTVVETEKEKKRKQTQINYQVNKQLQEFKELLDEYDTVSDKQYLKKELKEKFDQLSKQTFSKEEDIKKFKILQRRYNETIKQKLLYE